MARKVLATSTLKTAAASSGIQLIDDAITHEHIGIRTPTHAYAVAVDVDHSDWPEIVEEMVGHGLPRPTWICADPWTARAHLVWFLRDAVLLTTAGRKAPVNLLNTVCAVLTAAFRGDPAYTQTLTKNPWRLGRPLTRYGSPAVLALWEAHQESTTTLRHVVLPVPGLHDLRILRRALLTWQYKTGTPTPNRQRKVVVPEDVIPGTKLFHTLRYRVYAHWPLSAADVFGMAVEMAAALGSPIRERQLLGMARRMHTWCSRHYTAQRTAAGKEINRGRDHLENSGLELSEKQSVAAKKTALGKAKARPAVIEEAAVRLLAKGSVLTKAAIAAEAKCSTRTVQRYWGGGDISCPSGIAAVFAGLAVSSEKKKYPSLASRADVSQRTKVVVDRLLTVAVVAMKRGAKLSTPPHVSPDLVRIPDVRKAMNTAREAVEDLKRRVANRMAKSAADERRIQFQAAASELEPWIWWKKYRAALDDYFDSREQEPGLDRYAQAAIRISRKATFTARWGLWRRSLRSVSNGITRPRKAVSGLPMGHTEPRGV